MMKKPLRVKENMKKMKVVVRGLGSAAQADEAKNYW
jgi:hypothetical protein